MPCERPDLASAIRLILNPLDQAIRNVRLLPGLPPCCALPDNQDTPAGVEQCLAIFEIALNVSRQLVCPELLPCFWNLRESAVLMYVPETAMNEDRHAKSWHDDVRCTRKILPVQPKAVPGSKQRFPDNDFGFRIPRANGGHHATSGLSINDVRHCSLLPILRHLERRWRERGFKDLFQTLRAFRPFRYHFPA